MVDKKRIKKAFGKGLQTYNEEAKIQREVAEQLCKQITEKYHQILELGCGTGFLTEILLQKTTPKQYSAIDLLPEVSIFFDKILSQHPTVKSQFMAGDMEALPYPTRQDLIISSSALQWINNFPQVLHKVREALTPHGVFAFSTFGKENYKELRELNNLGLNYLSIEEMIQLLQQYGFSVEYSSETTVTYHFSSPLSLLRHIKNTGTNGILSTPWSKKDISAFQNTQLTYHPIIIVANKIANI